MPLQKRSLGLAGHRTSIALEPEFWAALADIAAARGLTLNTMIAELDGSRRPEQPLTSLLRVFALRTASAGPLVPDTNGRDR